MGSRLVPLSFLFTDWRGKGSRIDLREIKGFEIQLNLHLRPPLYNGLDGSEKSVGLLSNSICLSIIQKGMSE